MVFNATFNVVSSTPCLSWVRTHNISGNSIGSCKSNYHTITTAPTSKKKKEKKNAINN